MTKTNIEYFNNIYRNFVKEIAVIFPEYKLTIINKYELLLNNENELTNDIYVKEYMDSIKNNIELITTDDDSFFKGEEPLYFLREVDFRYIWDTKKSSNTKAQIRKYLKTLYLIGTRIVSATQDIDDIIKKFYNDGELDKDNLSEDSRKMFDVLESISSDKLNDDGIKEKYDKIMEGSSIGQLAQEIANEINLDDINLDNIESPADIMSNLMGGNFMDIVKNVGSKIQDKIQSGNIDSGVLVNEAQQMMSMMTNNNDFKDLLNLGNLGDLGNLGNLSNLGNPSNVSNNSRRSTTKDRLRKKLEERKNKKK
tara:strand:- start:3239 stop:4168 length:930 start_codon:yes stop_codon:yes gene_type:complete